jgi:hypothetical protein
MTDARIYVLILVVFYVKWVLSGVPISPPITVLQSSRAYQNDRKSPSYKIPVGFMALQGFLDHINDKH